MGKSLVKQWAACLHEERQGDRKSRAKSGEQQVVLWVEHPVDEGET